MDGPRETTIRGMTSALQRIARAVSALERLPVQDQALSPAQAETLRFAALTRPDMATVGQLARVLGVRHPTAVGIVQPLIDRGLVHRAPHPFDRRSHCLGLTGAGREAFASLDSRERALRDSLAVLSPDELHSAEAGLASVVRGLESAGLIVVSAPCAGCVHFRPGDGTSGEKPHRCDLIHRDLGDAESEMLCPEHAPASSR